jgi:hypothetical protein
MVGKIEDTYEIPLEEEIANAKREFESLLVIQISNHRSPARTFLNFRITY